ncbi:WD repeat domain-containing protein 83-like [Diaphorina citri]|uniref:WD repeat domain-containing protein 83 n=1 Tax=Diaphorina citri TaxID=121845 RepID=A0A3Q0J342_DIACI|nr:WD repeat domain-containing protein 83-like [Diaphorina citri]
MEYTCVQTIDCKQGAIRAVRFNVDGSYCLTCGSDKKIKLWNPYRNLLLKTYGGHAHEVNDATAACDSSQIASGASDKSVILWEVTTGQPVRRWREHASKVTCVKFNEDSSVVISGSQDNTVMMWDVKSRSHHPIQTSGVPVSSIKTTFLFKCNNLVFSEPIVDACFTRDCQCILTCSTDECLRLFDKATGELLEEYKGHKSGDFRIECCLDSKDSQIFCGSSDGKIYKWQLVDSSQISTLIHSVGKAVVNSLCSHPTRKHIMSACGNNVKLWTAEEDYGQGD